MKKINIYNVDNMVLEEQQKLFNTIISNGMIMENYNDKSVITFDINLLLSNDETKNLVKIDYLMTKAYNLAELLTNDNKLINSDIETELWDKI